MSPVVPPSMLFQFMPGSRCVPDIPSKRGDLLSLPESSEIFVPASLNRSNNPMRIWFGWNREGIGFQVEITGRTLPFRVNQRKTAQTDFVSFLIDTRPSTNVHRTTIWCTLISILLSDEGQDKQPSIRHKNLGPPENYREVSEIARAQTGCRVQLDRRNDTYRLQAWVPGSVLHGFAEVPEIGRIGLNCTVHDFELGSLPLILSGDFNLGIDPSAWMPIDLLP